MRYPRESARMIFTGILDRSAIAMSVLCIMHCIALPLAIVMVPSLAAYWFADENFHLMLVYFVLPTSIVAVGLGCRRHRSQLILIWAFSGLLMLSVAAGYGDSWSSTAEKVLTVIGASLVMISHIYNFKLCRSIDCDH